MPDLIATRYPALDSARQAWRQGSDVRALGGLPVDGVALLRLDASGGAAVIADADPRLSAFYGRPLGGEAAQELAPDSDIAAEAELAVESGHELLVEDTVNLGDGPVRMARLYLPLKPGPDADEVVCVVMLIATSAD